jgi:hypothetical protein
MGEAGSTADAVFKKRFIQCGVDTAPFSVTVWLREDRLFQGHFLVVIIAVFDF